MTRVVVEGWFLGLSTGPYCLGACAPFMVPYLFAEGRPTWFGNLRIIGEFLLGRLVAYLVFGALVGWMGVLLRPHVSQRITSLALGATAALMICYALITSLPRWKPCAWLGRRVPLGRFPLLLGFLIGINVCPPFLVAVARLVQMGEAASGAAFFLGFFAGTSLYTLPLLGASPFTPQARMQRIGRLCALLISLWFLLSALTGSFASPQAP